MADALAQKLGQARILDLLLPAVHQALIGFGAFLDSVNGHQGNLQGRSLGVK